MSTNTNGGVQLAVRVDQTLYAKILTRQREAKGKTGIEPSVAEVVRMLIERGIKASGRRR